MNRNLKRISNVVVLFFLLVYSKANSQGTKNTRDVDLTFKTARELAFDKQLKQAQDTLIHILDKYPNYLDVRSFLGNTYSWDGKHEMARKQFLKVLEADPKRKNDWVAVLKNELYSMYPQQVDLLIKRALIFFPEDVDILFLKAKLGEKNGKTDEVFLTLQKILTIDPTNEKVISFKENFLNSQRTNTIGIQLSTFHYDKSERVPSYFGTLSYSKKIKQGSVILKINYANRFETNGLQYELDMYPKITKTSYAYVNVGFSKDNFFPSERYGLEFFQSLPKKFEVSLGFRRLKFSETTLGYTGTISKYIGNNYLSVRAFFSKSNDVTSKSGAVTYRKYIKGPNNYFDVTLGYGVFPELTRLPVNQEQKVLLNLKSQRINAAYLFTNSKKNYLWRVFLGVMREEKSFARENYFLLYELGVSCNIRFK
ncbi:conserved exported hypothetical protein [Tenacibaculum sediminilitoris]|uniref:YaiO family outer membrane beta-barrel protein n=1 Tax=Tenacibaculum sediminilitoris TaxID=1820334 RepID=UPI0038939232